MIERQAWLYLYKKWKEAENPLLNHYRVNGNLGLCGCIDDLFYERKISENTMKKMKKIIHREQDRVNALFIFPLDKHGALSRANFCLKQANRLKVKK